MLLFIVFCANRKPRFDRPTPKSCRKPKGGSVGERGSLDDPAHAHMPHPKGKRLGLAHLAFEGLCQLRLCLNLAR